MEGDSASGRVLVIGGGIAGLSSALELARSGLSVDLVERNPTLGGHAILFTCKATDQCQKCTVCMVNDRIGQMPEEREVKVRTGTEVIGARPVDGRFSVEIKRLALPVDVEKCIACGLCSEACPTTPEPSIFLASDQGIPRVYTVRPETCLVYRGQECEKCVAVCPADAIDFGREAEISSESYDGIIVATGYRPFDAAGLTQYRYGSLPDVITGLDLEMRLRRESRLTRPSDGSVPRRIAFIQCVGSRDVRYNPYCSRVCCAYAVRCACKLHYLEPESEIAIFYMDLQAFGKDFPAWRDRLRDRVRLVRSRPAMIEPGPEGGLWVVYESVETGRIDRELFGLVVLSVGLCPGPDTRRLADMFGIEIDDDGFLGAGPPGLFLAGTCQGPRDIAGSIADASTAAGAMLQHLRQRRPIAAQSHSRER